MKIILILQEQHDTSDVNKLHSSSDEEVVQQDSRFDYYTMPSAANDDVELAGKEIPMTTHRQYSGTCYSVDTCIIHTLSKGPQRAP